MAYGTIIVNDYQPAFNVGDYIQSIAAMQFLPAGTSSILIDRDSISNYNNEDDVVKIIMNGWWMANPQNFPPSLSILPLYRSFHLRPRIEHMFFTHETISHLKKFQPIGCRDENTTRMMQAHGIDAYFSGCLTLTLGQTYKHQLQESSPVYMVDPFVGKFISKDIATSFFIFMRCLFVVVFKWKLINQIKNRIKETCPFHKKGYDLWLYSTKIGAIYSNVLGKKLLKSAIYRTHAIPGIKIPSHNGRLDYARNMLNEYSNAKFVITSRIHCGLPCLGIGIPVALVVSPNMIRSGRMGGLKNLFKQAFIKRGKCVLNKGDFEVKKIDVDYSFFNYNLYKKYADILINDCREFFFKE